MLRLQRLTSRSSLRPITNAERAVGVIGCVAKAKPAKERPMDRANAHGAASAELKTLRAMNVAPSAGVAGTSSKAKRKEPSRARSKGKLGIAAKNGAIAMTITAVAGMVTGTGEAIGIVTATAMMIAVGTVAAIMTGVMMAAGKVVATMIAATATIAVMTAGNAGTAIGEATVATTGADTVSAIAAITVQDAIMRPIATIAIAGSA